MTDYATRQDKKRQWSRETFVALVTSVGSKGTGHRSAQISRPSAKVSKGEGSNQELAVEEDSRNRSGASVGSVEHWATEHLNVPDGKQCNNNNSSRNSK